MLGYMSVVKFETKPGSAEAFVQNHKDHPLKDIEGLIEVTLIQTDENKFTWIAEYDDISSVVNAQDKLVAILDTQRHMLIDVTDENGVTDPESGQIVNRESRKVLPGTESIQECSKMSERPVPPNPHDYGLKETGYNGIQRTISNLKKKN